MLSSGIKFQAFNSAYRSPAFILMEAGLLTFIKQIGFLLNLLKTLHFKMCQLGFSSVVTWNERIVTPSSCEPPLLPYHLLWHHLPYLTGCLPWSKREAIPIWHMYIEWLFIVRQIVCYYVKIGYILLFEFALVNDLEWQEK